MKRRTYVAVVGGLLTAGCSSKDEPPATSPGSEETGTPTSAPTETPTSTRDNAFLEFDPESTYKTVEVGDRDGVENPDDNRAQTVRIWNDAASVRQIEVTIKARQNDPEGGNTVLDNDYDIPDDTQLTIELLEPENYIITLSVPADGGQKQFSISEDSFDCNWHQYQLTVHPDGRIDITEIATTMGCTTQTIGS